MDSVFLGIALHAVGGISAATCYVSQKGTPKWSWQTYWITSCVVAWFLMPLLVASLTTPDLLSVLADCPSETTLRITLLGAAYGFGGMAFAFAIRLIGFSLTYAIAIGISAVFGTIVPAVLNGTLVSGFQKPGGLIVLTGFLLSMAGVAICGRAGFMKEKGLKDSAEADAKGFDMKKGLMLATVAGVLSGVFGVAVAMAAPIDELVAERGTSPAFAGYVKYIFITGGALLTNLVWWGVVHFRKKTFGEFTSHEDGFGKLAFYYLMGIVSGMLWFGQFIFYEQGHMRMGDFKFISWGIHMAMLVFFSFGVGLFFKEWKGCQKKTLTTLAAGLVVLMISFSLITYGSSVGERVTSSAESASVSSLEELR